jgi:hypothetical protein
VSSRRPLAAVLGLCLGAAALASEPQPPPPELLEFVAIWESEDGAWFDPSQLEGWIRGVGDERQNGEDDG